MIKVPNEYKVKFLHIVHCDLYIYIYKKGHPWPKNPFLNIYNNIIIINNIPFYKYFVLIIQPL